jgi:AbrB family looped-hinge helix DNA binding protein
VCFLHIYWNPLSCPPSAPESRPKGNPNLPLSVADHISSFLDPTEHGFRCVLGFGEGSLDGIPNGKSPGMSATSTIDSAGRIVLPKSVRDQLHLRAGTKLRVKVVADRIELTPEPDTDVRVERRGRRMVIVGGPPLDAVKALKAAREEHDERLAHRVRGK